MEWKLAEAKNKFSEVINKVLLEGPQRITRRNERFVILEESEYDKLTGKKMDFISFLKSCPSLEGVDLTRDKSPMRDVDL